MNALRRVSIGSIAVWIALAPLASAVDVPFVRGDVDQDGELGIGDPIRLLHHMFLGDPPDLGCNDAADANDNGEIEIGDPVYELVYIFLGGDPPPGPFPSCGDDRTADPLSCREHNFCPAEIDTEPPQFRFGSCTEIACSSDEIPMTIGEPMDLVSEDSCNRCEPIQVEDEGGIHRVTVRLLSLSLSPELGDFSVTWTLNPPVETFVFAPELAKELIIPDSLRPGAHLRRFVAFDRYGNRASVDFPVALAGPLPVDVHDRHR